MPRRGVLIFPGQSEEDEMIKLNCFLNSYDKAKHPKGSKRFKFILKYLHKT